jgi:hypothetical protein
MADFSVHVAQAKHNEQVAGHLLKTVGYHDWAVTACFYAAIHFVEARCWYIIDIKHTDITIPVDGAGKLQYSPHAWRQQLIRDRFTEVVWRSYRKLQTNSEAVRYLATRGGPGPGPGPVFLNAPATDYISQQDVRKLVEKELQNIKIGLKIELAEFLHPLQVENEGRSEALLANQVFIKLLGNYNSKNEVLALSEIELKRVLSIQETAMFLKYCEGKR